MNRRFQGSGIILGPFSWACARGARFSQAKLDRAVGPLEFGRRGSDRPTGTSRSKV
jgi:hypothetical protein